MLGCISRNREGMVFFVHVIVVRSGRVYHSRGGGEDNLASNGGGIGQAKGER